MKCQREKEKEIGPANHNRNRNVLTASRRQISINHPVNHTRKYRSS